MQLKHLLPAMCLFSIAANAQQDTIETTLLSEYPERELDNVVISANKFTEHKKNVAQSIMTISKKDIEWMMPQTTAVMLEQTGNVFVQKSQLGGGSPVLRGFEASRVLLVIDGVRMNNAIYRAGHLQNVITVDNNLMDRVEVMYGPASTLYGSDALGGVILFKTIDPQVSGTNSTLVRANAMARYSSAYAEATGHFNFNIGFRKFASLTSVTYSKFGDLRQGNNRNPFYGDFGLRREYIETINGVDSIVANDDPNVQKGSAYNQVDLMQKFLFRQNDKISHTLNLQYSTTSDVPRYDRLTDRRNGALRWAQWYYGPQERVMAAYQFTANGLDGFFNDIKAGVNYQSIEESRHQRERNKAGLQSRIEKVNVIGYFADFRRMMNRHELVIGTDGQLNDVKSTASERNINDGEIEPIDTRYPSGGNKMNYHAVYAQHIFKIVPDKLILNDGLRLSYTNLESTFDTTFFHFPYTEAKQNHLAWSGNLGLIYMPIQPLRIVLNASTGFRAPNIDDLVKVFESAAGTQLIVPNPDLKPEYTYNLDLGIGWTCAGMKLDLTGFYTQFDNAIVVDRFNFNGQDSILYGGQLTAVTAAQNKAHAYIYGFNAAVTWPLTSYFSLYGTVNYTYGRFFDEDNNKVPLDHIPPVYGKVSANYRAGRFNTEGYALFNGWKTLSNYNPFGEDNLQYATQHGMPEWYTLNLKAGYQFRRHVSAEVGLENILDQNYRMFASGISAPGRNLVITLRGSF